MAQSIFKALNLTQDEERRLQAIRLAAMADQATRIRILPDVGIDISSFEVIEMTDTDFLLELLGRALLASQANR